jgi:hypothetical protein
MAFLTAAYIKSMLGGATDGAAKYAAVTRSDADTEAAWISAADLAVVSAAKKGGYSTVTSTGPVPASGEAFEMLRAMAFSVWLRMAYGYGKEIQVPGDIDAELPRPSALYASADEGRLDLPGLDRAQAGGDAGVDLQNGGILTTESVQQFTRVKLGLM